MNDKNSALRSNVSFLGQLLGKTIESHMGKAFLDKVETIRKLAKASRKGNDEARRKLLDTLHGLSDDELLPVTRAFSQFLNLANIAEQFHTISRHCEQSVCTLDPLDTLFDKLVKADFDEAQIQKAVESLSIELVLTAHPTEVTRRTMIAKHVRINECLELLELNDLGDRERKQLVTRLEQLINQSWHTDEIRKVRPTPVEEARGGFAVIENSLWTAVPDYMRQLDERLQTTFNMRLPMDSSIVTLTSWMGGDRDGNPFVTAKVTQEVLLSSRWVAADLYLNDFNQLVSELSMSDCNDELRALVGDTLEPYRTLLKKVRADLRETRDYLTAKLQGHYSESRDLITTTAQLREPLELCYRSLQSCGMEIIADGLLLDMLRRLSCFGVNLLRLDIRQESGRHTEVLSELTRYLGLGDYKSWSEADKQSFLLTELNSKRPLLPKKWKPSANVQEVLDTCNIIAAQQREALGVYNISMAAEPSDVLIVQLLLKEAGCPFRLPVSPLFETLDDLNKAPATIAKLLSVDWYRGYIKGHQYVMIGYSDSAKDAGVLASAWAQYRAMEELVAMCESYGIKLTLFHGRGGTIGRGGAPAHAALLSQPPGSLKGGFRVTEQGEMIRFKLGLPKVALQSLNMYTSAVLEANLLPPITPKPEWREVMDELADASCKAYRDIVRGHEDFVPYFRAATPEMELGKLPLGSRPSKRNPNGGVESLRAIPWIFAWSQNRLLLPAWLGSSEGFEAVLKSGKEQALSDMCVWPFFFNRLAMLEMVIMKADVGLSELYDRGLVPKELQYLGKELRDNLVHSEELIHQLTPKSGNLINDPWLKESLSLRNPYIDPLNVLQIELLRRSRASEEVCHVVDQALMVSMGGIAAGMRNTG
jgi:phosphoenolpyruvate carboxylase